MKKAFIILFFLSSNYLCSQTYSKYASNESVNDVLKFCIDNLKYNSFDKIKRKKIKSENIKWHEAFLTIYSKDSLNSFDSQFETILNRDNKLSSNYINKGLKKVKDIFSVKDIAFMRLQFDNEKNIIWNLKTKKGRFKSKPRRNYYIYSLPLFNLKKDKAIIFIENYCGGHCGGTRVEVLVKNNDKWVLYKSIGFWES